MAHDPFKNRHKFQDDVWGQIRLNDLERDVIDTPEFQRLFRTSQLGFVDLVYHTANHTRGAHSIGACRIANRLINRLVENTSDLHEKYKKTFAGLYASFEISPAERILIRLGALLHDVSHVPLSHDLEIKSHKIFYNENEELKLRSWYGHYFKHDDYENNPVLFTLICNNECSVLSRVLRHYSAHFWKQLQEDAKEETHRHLSNFVSVVSNTSDAAWKPERDLLPQLLFHLLFYEKPEEAEEPARKIAISFDNEKLIEKWHLGPKSLTRPQIKQWHDFWYQPYRHDIIGNTLSADLIDYLTRDPQRLGTQRRIDLHLLSYYVLVSLPSPRSGQYRCAIDLHDHKRKTTRTFLLNDIFRLLDLRQDIHEKAVVHRVVQSANAMLARGLLLLGNRKPPLRNIVGLGKEQQHALQSEDSFFNQLLTICNESAGVSGEEGRRLNEACRLFQKLVERRVCRPLVMIPGDWANENLTLPKAPNSNDEVKDYPLRTLAALVDSAHYSPFLLFVCSCMEKYLEGVFDTEAEVCNYVEAIAANDAKDGLVQQAMNLVPSRVITWTLPYKQLYKDPALVVALGKGIGQIDEVIKPTFRPHITLDTSTHDRIQTAILDADSKYESLWQLYVFISDGLFYSGVLNKLLAYLPPDCAGAQERTQHKRRLETAQEFLSLAFKTICENWSGQNARTEDIAIKQKLLGKCMEAKEFKEVLKTWVVSFSAKSAWPKELHTIDIEHYYHESSFNKNEEDELKRPCRDSRYKYDNDSQRLWAGAMQAPGSDGHKLIQFLKQCHIEDSKLLSEGEFKLLVELFKDKDTQARCNSLLREAASDQTFIPRALKTLWLAGFPWLEPKQKVRIELELPKNEIEVKKWLLDEAEILLPNVRRQLTEDIGPVVDVLVWASPRYERSVFDDFKLRLQNESTLMWNDIRLGRIVGALKRKWNYPDAAALSEDDDKD